MSPFCIFVSCWSQRYKKETYMTTNHTLDFSSSCMSPFCIFVSCWSQIFRTVTSSGQEGVSKYVDQVFDSAFNLTQEAGDLPNVRWGRINYLNVTKLTTKWNVWS